MAGSTDRPPGRVYGVSLARRPEPRLLFVDTETTGLPRDWRAPVTEVDNWPRAVQIAWELTDGAGAVLETVSHLIRPDGFEIPAESTRVHGITTERAQREGTGLIEALDALDRAAAAAGVLVAHNVDFDRRILLAELIRARRESPVPALPTFCTMRTSAAVCRIPGKRGFKWPNLGELHHSLFGEAFADAHDAAADVGACRRSFFELVERGHYRLDVG